MNVKTCDYLHAKQNLHRAGQGAAPMMSAATTMTVLGFIALIF